MSEAFTHEPVLLERCLALLAPALVRPDAIVVDATLGLGGHSEAMLERFPDLRLVGLDRDPTALAMSRDRLAPFAHRTTLVHAIYDELPSILADLGLSAVDGVLFDLGVSSMQLDDSDRGFAYAQDAPLDMRMDPDDPMTAADVVNTYSAQDLARVLRLYGDERFASRIAARVVKEREREPFDSTARLAELVRESIPAAARRTGGHPAKRTFQALRIEVNGELDALERAIPAAIDALKVGGRIVVMSYQSLEDRIVKAALTSRSRSTSPIDLPVELPGHGPELRLLTRGAETADDEEQRRNPRSAPARLRAAERLKVAA
jgi:16S rRNA (cytosine1402-N4)-methyltransferase